MSAPIPAQGAGRIRWEPLLGGNFDGYVGTRAAPMFEVVLISRSTSTWAVRSDLLTYYSTGTHPDDLKAEAERWLEEFVSSLGAVFPDRLREAVTAERDRRSNAALAVDPEWAAERHFGWADALDWVLALTGGTAPPSAGGGDQ